jgi:hypothetical protein
MERVVTVVLQIVAAILAIILMAGHQAPGESWLAPAFMGFLAALLIDQGRAVLLPRLRLARRRRSIPAEYPRP